MRKFGFYLAAVVGLVAAFAATEFYRLRVDNKRMSDRQAALDAALKAELRVGDDAGKIENVFKKHGLVASFEIQGVSYLDAKSAGRYFARVPAEGKWKRDLAVTVYVDQEKRVRAIETLWDPGI